MLKAKSGKGYKFDPLKPHALLSASYDTKEGQHIDWEHPVKYRPDVRDSHV
jgi:hypothetical protein